MLLIERETRPTVPMDALQRARAEELRIRSAKTRLDEEDRIFAANEAAAAAQEEQEKASAERLAVRLARLGARQSARAEQRKIEQRAEREIALLGVAGHQRKEAARARYAANRADIITRSKEYYHQNREEILQKAAQKKKHDGDQLRQKIETARLRVAARAIFFSHVGPGISMPADLLCAEVARLRVRRAVRTVAQ